MASQLGTLTLPDTWFRPPFWDLPVLQLLRPDSSNLPCLYLTFHLEYPWVLSRFCLVCHAIKLHIYMYIFHEESKSFTLLGASPACIRVIFLLEKNPALSEVQKYVFDSVETPFNKRQYFCFDMIMWQGCVSSRKIERLAIIKISK